MKTLFNDHFYWKFQAPNTEDLDDFIWSCNKYDGAPWDDLCSVKTLQIEQDILHLLQPSIRKLCEVSGVDINGELDVNSTNYFPTTGYILIKLSSGIYAGTTSVFEYTGKNATTFTGVTKIRGDGFPSTGDEVIPFTID